MDLSFTFGADSKPSRLEADAPFRLLVIGNFNGQGKPGDASAAVLKRIDIDNFDEILASFRPSLKVSLAAQALEIKFESLEDFHPDELIGRVAEFSNADKVVAITATPTAAPTVAADARESDDAMLERLLGSRPQPNSAPTTQEPSINLDKLFHDAIAPALVSDNDARAHALSKDEAQGVLLRELLHSAEFQQLEAAWRGLHWLVFENEAEENLKISVLNISKSDLAADLSAHADDLSRASLYRHVVSDAHAQFGGNAYNAIIANFEFSASADDIKMLAAVGAIASRAGAPIIGGALPRLLGGTGFENETDPTAWTHTDTASAIQWQALRECAQASSIGLVMPRLIGRLPYGKRGETIERFDFEELELPLEHENFLWLNGAFGAAQLLVSAFARSAWAMNPGEIYDIKDLPAALYATDEGPSLMPCAESLLSHAEAAHLQDNGVMVLMSHRDRNVVRLARMQSIASPTSPLAGPWNDGTANS